MPKDRLSEKECAIRSVFFEKNNILKLDLDKRSKMRYNKPEGRKSVVGERAWLHTKRKRVGTSRAKIPL